MDHSRLQRVESQVQKDLAEIFRDIAQNNFRGNLITVSSVRISPDLSIARVNLSVFPVAQQAPVLAFAEEQSAQIKDRLVRKMQGSLRRMPQLYFYLDTALEREAEIDRILKGGGESPIT